MHDPQLLSVSQAATLLYRRPSGVRKLMVLGKLTVTKQGKTCWIHADSVAAFIASQPHPIQLTATMYFCFNVLSSGKRQASVERRERWSSLETWDDMSPAFREHYLANITPLMEQFLSVLKARQYEVAEGLRHRMWEIDLAYHTLHEPMQSDAVRPTYRSPEWALDKVPPG